MAIYPACPGDDILSAFLRAELPDKALEEVAEHLVVCAQCETKACDALTGADTLRVVLPLGTLQAWSVDDAQLEKMIERAKYICRSSAESVNSIPTRWVAGTSELPSGNRDSVTPTIAGMSSDTIGSYQILRLLGEGSFGKVYLAFDPELKRQVAVKVPGSERFSREVTAERFLREAQAAASLPRHPGIVFVYQFGRLANGMCFVAMEYVEGESLKEHLGSSSLSVDTAIELIIRIADALHHAHKHGLVHRDLKPANIMLDKSHRPLIADFGLALADRPWQDRGVEFAGTPSYMAPEQIRGETHRVHWQTDVWALGVIFYELVAGRRPFHANGRHRLQEQILRSEPTPLRQIDESIPAELERICLRCLAGRMSDRYPSAKHLADDLRHWREHRTDIPSSTVSKVVPKGLRNFDFEDADFFLELLPGPRDRNGLPESVRFWKRRIEELDDDKTFRVGVLLGPSGSGKTSLLRAGLLPRLGEHVLTVCVEARPEKTEKRLHAQIQKVMSGAEPGRNLRDTLALIRHGNGLPAGCKLLIVVDQFEQWLNDNEVEAGGELVEALRQCDGGRLQAMLLIRDDFTLALTRFMDALEVSLQQSKNFSTVDLFGVDHARRVLTAFGRALGTVKDDLSRENEQFISAAVKELEDDGRIVPVRLSLLAAMGKDKPWTPEVLRDFGGPHGLGVAFLDDRLNGPAAHPMLRAHKVLTRRILEILLPEDHASIRGGVVARSELIRRLPPNERRETADEVLRLLDTELRLITPADTGAGSESDSSSTGTLGGFQLTHDYLVPTLRKWLTASDRATWQGRGKLRLQELAAQWKYRKEQRFLPTFFEYARIMAAVPKSQRTTTERELIRNATRRHGLRLGVISVLALSVCMSWQFMHSVTVNERVKTRIDRFIEVDPNGLYESLKPLNRDKAVATRLLKQRLRHEGGERKTRVALGLAALIGCDAGLADVLVDGIASAPAGESPNIVSALSGCGEAVRSMLLNRMISESDPRKKIHYASVMLNLGDPRAAVDVLKLANDPVLQTEFIHHYADFRHTNLTVASQQLVQKNIGHTFTAGLCLAIGLMDPEELPERSCRLTIESLQSLYRSAPDTGTHSAAGWVLQRWNAKLPMLEASREPQQSKSWYVSRRGMTMLKIGPGTFLRRRGSTPPGQSASSQSASSDTQQVILTQPFYLCDREVTVGQFLDFVEDTKYSESSKPTEWKGHLQRVSPTDDCPVNQVNWVDAIKYCNWLSEKERLKPCYKFVREQQGSAKWRRIPDADGYRLPTEAEWEFACRTGTTTAFSFGDDISLLPSYTWIMNNSEGRSWPAGNKLPNAWGFYDTHGNVQEWCEDWYHEYAAEPSVVDPIGVDTGQDRVVRGGSYLTSTDNRSSDRSHLEPTSRYIRVGFRVARDAN